MKLDLNKPIKNLDGTEIKDINMGKLLANAMANDNKGNSIKIFDWALKLWNNQPIDIDDSDKNWLKEYIDNNQVMTVLAKAQVLKVINEAK